MESKNLFFVFCFLTAISVNFAKETNKCKILALSGGGDKGAYQAGAIQGLISVLPSAETQWDVVSGISIGSLNGLFLSIFEKGKEKEAGEKLLEAWRNIDGGHAIYKNWPLGVVWGLIYQSGLYNTAPGYDFVNNIIKDSSGLKRDYVIGAVNVKNGAYQIFTNKDLKTTQDCTNAAMCSGAFPVVFPFGKFSGQTYMDGGVKHSVDIASAVHICLDKGFSHEDIIVDVVMCSNHVLQEVDAKSLTPIPIIMRYFDIDGYDKTLGDLDDAERFLKGVKIRYVVAPTKSLPSGKIPLSFSPKEIEQMIQLGQSDAKLVVKKGSGVYYQQLKKTRNEEKFYRYTGKVKTEI